MRRPSLRLPLPRRQDPVLTEDEMDWIADLARERVAEHVAEMDNGLVSESVIRSRMYGESVLSKLYQAGAWKPEPDSLEP